MSLSRKRKCSLRVFGVIHMAAVLAAFLCIWAPASSLAHPLEPAGFDREEGYYEDRLKFEPMSKAIARGFLNQQEADIITETVSAHLERAFWFSSAMRPALLAVSAMDLDGDWEREILIFPRRWQNMGFLCRPICPLPIVILTRDQEQETGFRFVGVVPAASIADYDPKNGTVFFLYVGTYNGAGWRSLSDGPLRPSSRTVGGEAVPMGGNRFCYTAAEPPPSDFRFYGEPFTFAEMRMGFPYQEGHPGYFLTVPYHQLCP